jgi:CheY-like chemotaxis protein
VDSGIQLMERLRHAVFDVVLMDVQMPELDGLETTRRIRRELPPESQPYIIAVTAAAFPEDRMRCLEAGMNDYLAKPVDLAELTNALRRARPPIALQAGPDVPATSAV